MTSRASACLRWAAARQRGAVLGSVAPSRATAASITHCSGQSTVPAPSASRPPRFYVPSPLAASGVGSLHRLPDEEARHATKTLRLREGDRLELCDGLGYTVVAELTAADRSGAVVTSVEAPVQVPRTGWQWEVACACGSLKGGRSDWLVEKCAELGAAKFTPLLTERSPTIGSGSAEEGRAHSSKRAGRRQGGEEAAEGDEAALGSGSGREGRWARVATAAMKQCLRPHALAIAPPCTVQQLCLRVAAADVALVGAAGAPPLAALAATLPVGDQARHGILCIGPEGDWTPQELMMLVASGAQPVGLGQLRLRAETAAVALLSFCSMQLAAPEPE